MRADVFQTRLQGAVRLLLYLLLGGLLLLAEALLVILIHRMVARYSPETGGEPTYLATALAAIIFLPVFSRLRWGLDSVLFHDTYELSVVLQDFSQQFGSLSDHESITRFLLDGLDRTLNLAAIAYVALPEGLDAGVMQVLEAGDIRARGRYATEEGKAQMLAGLAGLPKDAEIALRHGKALRAPLDWLRVAGVDRVSVGRIHRGSASDWAEAPWRVTAAERSPVARDRGASCRNCLCQCLADPGVACLAGAGADVH